MASVMTEFVVIGIEEYKALLKKATLYDVIKGKAENESYLSEWERLLYNIKQKATDEA